MKTKYLVKKINILIPLALCLLLISCKKEIYHELSEDDLAFLVYDIGKQFKLRDEVTKDTITFNVVNKNIEKIDKTGRYKIFPSNKKYFGEAANLYFEALECTGNISVSNIHLELENESTVCVNFSLANCFQITGACVYNFFGKIEANGKIYDNAFLFSSHMHELYFSKEKGFLRIDDISTGNILYTIVE